MRILLATYWELPHIGGVNNYVNQLKKGLEQQGHQVDIFCQQLGGKAYCILNKNLILEKSKVFPLLNAKVNHSIGQHFPMIGAEAKKSEIEQYCFEVAAAYFDLESYDIIHTQDIISTRSFARIKSQKTPLVATIHGCLAKELFVRLNNQEHLTEKDKNTPLWLYNMAREYLGATSSDITILPTQWLKNIMMEFSVPANHMTIIPYGIDVDLFVQNMNAPTQFARPKEKKLSSVLHALTRLRAIPIF